MLYPSQTAAPSRGFLDFLLRAPAATVADPESGSTTEVSDSDEEEEVEAGEAAAAAAVEPVNPVLPSSPRPSASNQHTLPQETAPTSESDQKDPKDTRSTIGFIQEFCLSQKFWLFPPPIILTFFTLKISTFCLKLKF